MMQRDASSRPEGSAQDTIHVWKPNAATIWNRVYEQALDEGHLPLAAVAAANWYCRANGLSR